MAPKRASEGAQNADVKKAKMAEDRKAFLKVFDQLRAELVQAEKDDAQVQIAVDWIDKMVEYNVPHGVDMNAINDGLVLECQIYSMLKKHCKGLACYPDLLEMFHDVSYQTASGQLIDLITAPIGVVDLSKYTEEAYMRIVTYKTAFYTFYLPAASAMRLAGITDEAAYAKANEICKLLGQFFQIQDDYLDCYGDPEVIGKIGTDIQDNKCGWLVVQALKKCDASQRKVIEDNYGKKDKACEKRIKELYVALDLEAVYEAYEEESYRRLKGIIEGQKLLPHELFGAMLARIYKRQK